MRTPLTDQPTPRILIDATAVPEDRRGVGRYVDELIRALPGPISVACQARDAEHYRGLNPEAEVIPVRGIERTPLRLLWEQFGLVRLARRAGATLIQSPHYTVPVFGRIKRVVTFHDATFFTMPQVHTALKVPFFRTWIRISRRRADAVIVISKATAAELTEQVGRPRGGYNVVYLAVDHERFRPASARAIEAVRSDLGLPPRWILYLGTVEPRKNVPALVTAYASVHKRRASRDLPALVIAGADGWGPPLDPDLDAARTEGADVRRVGYLPLESVPALLSGAEIVAYPSLGEGFGLPVVEAMACGAPVLTTRRLSIPEVGGDAVEYTEPDAGAIADALERLLDDGARRAALREAGPRRAAEFTWARCAAEHVAVYRSVT